MVHMCVSLGLEGVFLCVQGWTQNTQFVSITSAADFSAGRRRETDGISKGKLSTTDPLILPPKIESTQQKKKTRRKKEKERVMENIRDDELEKEVIALCGSDDTMKVRDLLLMNNGVLRNATVMEKGMLRAVRLGRLLMLSMLVDLCPFDGAFDATVKSRVVHAVCRAGSLNMYELLIEKQHWPVHVLDDDGSSCFHLACRGGNLEICRRLVKKIGLDPKLVTDNDTTGLHFAVRSGSLEVVRYLCEDLAFDPVKIEAPSTRKALTLSRGGTLRGSFEIYEREASTVVSVHDGWTLLHWACAGGSLDVVQYLLGTHYGSFVDINHLSSHNQTCLHVAATTTTSQSAGLLYYLIASKHMSPNVVDNDGNTPLHLACTTGDLVCIEALLSNGARPFANHEGAMPYDVIHPSRPLHDRVRFLCEAYNPTMAYHAVEFELLDKFCVADNKLGRGKCGVVYRGELYGTPVAIKTFVGDSERYFKHEVGILSRIHHPFIVTFLAASVEGTRCLVMEYVAGGTVRDAIHTRGAEYSWADRVDWLHSVACAVEWLHNQKPFILHRDVKSNNILLTSDRKAKLSDFGLASIESNIFVRKVYASILPAGEMSTKRSDVFSYGLVMVELFVSRVATMTSYVELLTAAQNVLQSADMQQPIVLQLAQDCLKHVPQFRPDFALLIRGLRTTMVEPVASAEAAAFERVTRGLYIEASNWVAIQEAASAAATEGGSYTSFNAGGEYLWMSAPPPPPPPSSHQDPFFSQSNKKARIQQISE